MQKLYIKNGNTTNNLGRNEYYPMSALEIIMGNIGINLEQPRTSERTEEVTCVS